jgi:hypothetical protein
MRFGRLQLFVGINHIPFIERARQPVNPPDLRTSRRLPSGFETETNPGDLRPDTPTAGPDQWRRPSLKPHSPVHRARSPSSGQERRGHRLHGERSMTAGRRTNNSLECMHIVVDIHIFGDFAILQAEQGATLRCR